MNSDLCGSEVVSPNIQQLPFPLDHVTFSLMNHEQNEYCSGWLTILVHSATRHDQNKQIQLLVDSMGIHNPIHEKIVAREDTTKTTIGQVTVWCPNCHVKKYAGESKGSDLRVLLLFNIQGLHIGRSVRWGSKYQQYTIGCWNKLCETLKIFTVHCASSHQHDSLIMVVRILL